MKRRVNRKSSELWRSSCLLPAPWCLQLDPQEKVVDNCGLVNPTLREFIGGAVAGFVIETKIEV